MKEIKAEKDMRLGNFLADAGLVVSFSEARRLIHGGFVSVDETEAISTMLPVRKGQTIRIGKRHNQPV